MAKATARHILVETEEKCQSLKDEIGGGIIPVAIVPPPQPVGEVELAEVTERVTGEDRSG